MLYWLGVYLLVIVGVAVPFLALYVGGVLLWLALGSIRFAKRRLKDALTLQPDFSRTQWSVIRRKAA
jgi:hypothetical protein